LLTERPGRMFQIALIYSLCGICKSNISREIFITNVRSHIDSDILNFLLLDLGKFYPGEYISKQFSWLLAEAEDNKTSLHILMNELVRSREASLHMIKTANAQANIDPSVENANIPDGNDAEKNKLTIEQASLLFEMFEHNISMKKFDDAIDIGKTLLLAGFFVPKIIQRMARLADFKFDKVSSKNIAKFGQYIDLNGMMSLIETVNYTEDCVSENPLKFIQALVKSIVLNPNKLQNAMSLIGKFSGNFDSKKLEKVFASILMLDNEQSTAKAAGFVAIEKPLLAIRIIENLISKGDRSDGIRIAYSQAISFVGRLEEGLNIMDDARKVQKTSANYRETFRLYVLGGMYGQSLSSLKMHNTEKLNLVTCTQEKFILVAA